MFLLMFFSSSFFFSVMLTGAMTIIEPGSSAQLVIALLVVQINMLFVLKLGPFVDDADDYLSFLTSFQMLLTLLGGLLIKTDNPDDPTYDADVMGVILIVINSFGFIALALSLMALHPKVRACLNNRSKSKGKSEVTSTQVMPISTTKSTDGDEDEALKIKNWELG
jgi:peptidoglycan/LPS O-acetylase OafA/YrhL